MASQRVAHCYGNVGRDQVSISNHTQLEKRKFCVLTLGATLVRRRKTLTRTRGHQGYDVSAHGECSRPAFHTLLSTTTLGGYAFPEDRRSHQFSQRALLSKYLCNLSDIVSMSVHITRCTLSTFRFIHFTNTTHVSEQYVQPRVPDFTNINYHISVTHDS